MKVLDDIPQTATGENIDEGDSLPVNIEITYWLSRYSWIAALAIGVAAFVLLWPLDVPISHWGSWLQERLPNDIRREWTAWQQYGQLTATAVACVLIYLLDPQRRRRLSDLILAYLIAGIPLLLSRLFIGRFRPTDQPPDPRIFFRSLGGDAFGINHPSSFLSAHVMYAVILSIFLWSLYPRLRWLTIALTVLVATGRVVFGAHWTTDVVVGATLGWIIGIIVVQKQIGTRLWHAIRNRRQIPSES